MFGFTTFLTTFVEIFYMTYKKRLKKILSIPSQPQNEWFMIDHITSVLTGIYGVTFSVDTMGNVLAVKGIPVDGELYPLIMAHTDTVHEIPADMDLIKINEKFITDEHVIRSWSNNEINLKNQTMLWSEYDGEPYGCGGDDKCGVHICLEIIKKHTGPIKVAFFVSEEIGMLGSKDADPDFFQNIAYGLEFDAPFNDLITKRCSGLPLFDVDGEFGVQVLDILRSYGIKWDLQTHPFTDVLQMKARFMFDNINFSSGYYNMHSPYEFVIVEQVELAQRMAEDIINKLPRGKKYIS